jgi:cobalt/nickel transport system permease protein
MLSRPRRAAAGAFSFSRFTSRVPMNLAFRALPCPVSPLRCLDPRWKLAGLVLLTVAIACLHHPMPAAVALISTLLLAALGRLPPRWLFARLGATALFLSPFVVSLPFLVHRPNADLSLGPLVVPYGLGVALLLALKALAVVALMLVLLATAPLDATLKAAHSLRIPGLLVQLGLLTYRYLFVLSSELRRLRVALRVRGYRNRVSRHSYRTVGHVAGTMLVRGVERAERVVQAMRCRGFDGRFRSLTPFQTRAPDVAAFVLLAGVAAGLLLWDLRMP